MWGNWRGYKWSLTLTLEGGLPTARAPPPPPRPMSEARVDDENGQVPGPAHQAGRKMHKSSLSAILVVDYVCSRYSVQLVPGGPIRGLSTGLRVLDIFRRRLPGALVSSGLPPYYSINGRWPPLPKVRVKPWSVGPIAKLPACLPSPRVRCASPFHSRPIANRGPRISLKRCAAAILFRPGRWSTPGRHEQSSWPSRDRRLRAAPRDRSPAGPFLRAQRESVGGWPMAITTHQTFGDLPKPVAAHRGVTGDRESPLEELMQQAAGGPRGPGAVPEADYSLGNPVGAIG